MTAIRINIDCHQEEKKSVSRVVARESGTESATRNRREEHPALPYRLVRLDVGSG